MKNTKNKSVLFFFLLLLSAIFIRVWGIFYATSGDLTNHISWGKAGFEQGFYLLYDFSFSRIGISNLNYPPLTVYMFTGLYTLFIFWKWFMWQLNLAIGIFPSFLLPLLQSDYILTILLKLPAICADIGLGVVLWFFGKRIFRTDTNYMLVMLALLWLAPTFWYISSMWAQLDSIPLFFLLLSWYFLFQKKSTVSIIFITCAILTKQTAIIFVPFYFLYLHQKEGILESVKQFLLFIFLVWISFIPFVNIVHFPFDPFRLYIQKMVFAPSSEFATSYAFNFWSLVVSIRQTLDGVPFIGTISIRYFGFIVTVLLVAIVHLGLFLTRKFKNGYLFWLAQLLIAMTVFMFLTRLHERHLLPVVLFAIVTGLANSKMRVVAFFLSLLQFSSLVYVWDVFNFHTEQFIDPLIGMKILVTVFILLYVAILIYYLRQIFSQKAKST